jgi:hypothetical protein
MSEIQCNFCNKYFSNVYTLNVHKRTAKYCLEIQNKKFPEQFKCQYCNKSFTRNSYLNKHISTCKEFDTSKYSNDVERLQKENERLQKEILKVKKLYDEQKEVTTEQLKELNTVSIFKTLLDEEKLKVEKLENQIKVMYEKTLEKVNVTQVNNTSTSHIINNKNKLIQNLQPLTYKCIEEQTPKLKIENVKDHANSLAEFYYKNALKDKLIVNDRNRLIFSFKDD